jgi:hypothetical protein
VAFSLYFILFHFISLLSMLVHNFVDGKQKKKKLGVLYIDILRLTHCQVVEELSAGGSNVQKLQITCLVAGKPLKQGTDDGEIAT